MNENNQFPEVKVYKYAVTLGNNELSSEEELYKKAELKYLLIKKIERAIKESAIDCALNRNGNIFPEEVKLYNNCIEPGSTNNDKNKQTCPALCDYMNCDFKCDSKSLNDKFFDQNINSYINLSKNDIDSSTFTHTLAKNEIESIKLKIKELYRIKYLYTLNDIINYVKNEYIGDKNVLFDQYFVFKALNDLTPVTENDFNNFKDTIFDKFNRQGYLIYINKYYIYQPFDQNENVPMYYRSVFDKPIQSNLTLYNYLKNIEKLPATIKKKQDSNDNIINKSDNIYDFHSTMEYYDSRDEFKYVGIIDKESTRKKTKSIDELNDIFKIREKRPKFLTKKRNIGLSSVFGSVCSTSKSRETLEKIAKHLDIKTEHINTRSDICNFIKDKLLFLEKYSTGKNNITYIMTPINHPIYPFPYNLENRTKMILSKIKDKIKFTLNISKKKIKKKIQNSDVITYIITISHNNNLQEFSDFLKSLGFNLLDNKWILNID